MKNLFLPLMAIVIVAIVSVSCENTEKKNIENTHTVSGQEYTCPMHPEVISDKPGSCPTCGMDLVKKAASEPMEMEQDSTMPRDSTMKM
ncbi:MAG: hypothetical protein H7259_03405 [Cytophagales bacterium]|nr:hypothetical protein [Cytophaga sp.]